MNRLADGSELRFSFDALHKHIQAEGSPMTMSDDQLRRFEEARTRREIELVLAHLVYRKTACPSCSGNGRRRDFYAGAWWTQFCPCCTGRGWEETPMHPDQAAKFDLDGFVFEIDRQTGTPNRAWPLLACR